MPTNKHVIEVQGKGFGKVKGQAQGLGGAMGGLAKKVGLVAGAYFAGKGLINAFQFATRVGKEFEQSMANLKAISGATGSEMLKLSANARQLGASTKFTASQVGELSVNYAKLGFSAKEILKVSEATLNLASATGEDLATSASVAGGTLRGFGLQAKQTSMVTDVMAKSFSSSALDLSKFSESMKYVAPIARQAGFSIQETTAILGQMANSSIDGSMAGTSLSKIIAEMSISGSKLSQVFGKSVDGFDEFVAVLKETKEQGGLTETQLALIPTLLRKTIPVLIESSDKMMAYKQSLDDAGGSAERMANIQMDTLEGKMLTLNSATEGLGISFFDTFDDVLKGAVDGVISFVSALDRMIAIPVSEKIREEQTEFNNLMDVLSDVNILQGTRNDIIDTLQSKYSEYIGNMDLESASYSQLKKLMAEVNNEFERKIQLQAGEEILRAEYEKTLLIQVELSNAQLEYKQAQRDGLGDTQIMADAISVAGFNTLRFAQNIRTLQEELQVSQSAYQQMKDDLVGLGISFQNTGSEAEAFAGKVSGGGGGGSPELEGIELLQLEFKRLTALREIDNIAKINQMALDLAFKDGADQITQSYLDQATAMLQTTTPFEAYKTAQQGVIDTQAQQSEWNQKLIDEFPELASAMGLSMGLQLSGLESLQIAYDGIAEKMALDREAKIQQIALDLAIKEGVDSVTQSYLDQAEAMTEQQEKTQEYIDGFQAVGETVGVWADTVGGLYDAVYENKKQKRDKDMADEIKLVQISSATEQEKNAKIQNIKQEYQDKDKQARKAMKPVKYAEAVSSIALGIAKALGSAPPPWNIILAGITAGAGAVQLGTIAGSEYAMGGLIAGGSHAQGGVNINAEGGEFMMRREAVSRIGVDTLSNMNEGGGGGITLNISAPLIDDTIIDVIVPAIDRARREGLA